MNDDIEPSRTSGDAVWARRQDRRGKTPRSDGAANLEVFPSTVCAQTCTTDTTQSKESIALDGVAIRCPRTERRGPYGDYLKCGKTEFVRAIFYGHNGS